MLETFELFYLEHTGLTFAYLFFVGLCIGSFLNVLIYRLPVMMERSWRLQAREILVEYGELESQQIPEVSSRKSFNLVFPASTCPHCGTSIRAWQNIPILSYLLLRGKCNACGAPISARYPTIELLAGLLTVFLLWHFGASHQFLAMLVLTYSLLALAFIDYDTQLLPDSMTIPLIWLGLMLNSQSLFTSLENALWGAVTGYVSLWMVANGFKLVTGKEGMGYGDLKLMALFGAWFGWIYLPNIIFMSALVGAILGIVLIIFSKRDSQKPVPYGPFIIIAGWITVIYPDQANLFNLLGVIK